MYYIVFYSTLYFLISSIEKYRDFRKNGTNGTQGEKYTKSLILRALRDLPHAHMLEADPQAFQVGISLLGMRQKLEDEIARFNIFQRSVLGSKDKVGNRQDTDIRNYAKYILKEGAVTEKRELLANLRSKIVYKDKELTLID